MVVNSWNNFLVLAYFVSPNRLVSIIFQVLQSCRHSFSCYCSDICQGATYIYLSRISMVHICKRAFLPVQMGSKVGRPSLAGTVTFLPSISFGTDRTLPTTLSFHSFLSRRSLGSSVSRTSLFSFDSITTITAGCSRGSRNSIYTRNTISAWLPMIAQSSL